MGRTLAPLAGPVKYNLRMADTKDDVAELKAQIERMSAELERARAQAGIVDPGAKPTERELRVIERGKKIDALPVEDQVAMAIGNMPPHLQDEFSEKL